MDGDLFLVMDKPLRTEIGSVSGKKQKKSIK